MNNRTMLIRAALLAIVTMYLLPANVAAQGINADYLPFSKDLLRPFPLKRWPMPDDLHNGEALMVSGVKIVEEVHDTATETTRQLVFSGRDLSGKEWRLKSEGCFFCDAVYEGDLDHNGVRDLIVASGTGGVGLAPPTHLIFLTFNRLGRPSLFAATGYYDLKANGVFEVADLDGDGRAELVHMAFGEGYWVTTIYRVREGRWSRTEGRFAGLRFPLYTRFTKRPNHTPVKPVHGRYPVAPDLLEENRHRESAPRARR